MNTLRRLAPGVHVLDAPQRFLGLELGTRMTVLELDGQLLIHSPVAVPLSVTDTVVPSTVSGGVNTYDGGDTTASTDGRTSHVADPKAR